jgi:DNA-directed RNA polymerase subunit omega
MLVQCCATIYQTRRLIALFPSVDQQNLAIALESRYDWKFSRLPYHLMLPSPDILNEFEHGKFVLSNLAAKRAKQLREGAMPLVQVESNHPLTIALAEIAAGKIRAILPTSTGVAVIEDPSVTVLVDDTMPGELGLLLPALDETEAALVSDVSLGEEEHEGEIDGEEPDAMSLSDLVGEEDEDAVAASASDEDTLSLTDIAEQESAEDSEDEPE